MAYLSFSEIGGPTAAAVLQAAPVADRLTALEWAVVRIARKDGLGSLREPGRFTTFLRVLLKRPNPMLADKRLEALRRIAVLSWQYGYTVPSREVRALFEAGFTPRQYEALMDGIGASRAVTPRTVVA